MSATKALVGNLIMIICVGLLFCSTSQGAYLKNVPVIVMQPNGVELNIYASGDEFYNYLHDKEGFTIIQDPQTGYYVYAVKKGEDLVSSSFSINEVDPGSLGISKHLTIPIGMRFSPEVLFPGGSPAKSQEIFSAPKTGTVNNIAIFIRFDGENEFTTPISVYSNMFNDNSAGAISMHNYFWEVSYNQLVISSTFYPSTTTTVLSYKDSQPRGYYQPYNLVSNPIGYDTNSPTERRDREHMLLKNAVDSISSQIPNNLVIDGDGDGNVDNVCFIVYGSPTGWNSLLWPHMWSLTSQNVYINSKRVYTYNFQLETSLNTNGAGVLSHEMFHSLGAPDLYHYSNCSSDTSLQPVYKWDIMANSSDPPPHMGAYMKMRYGTWISTIPVISTSGTYTLNPLTSSTNNSYKIVSPNSSKEYFVVEYRKKIGTFEGSLPDSGLLVYRINTVQDGSGNSCGPPDEVYIYRQGGTSSNNGTPDNANFSSNVGRTAINDSTNPSSFLSNGNAGGLNISSIGSVGATISFTVNLGSSQDMYFDLNGDGKTDLLWQNMQYGNVYVWYMDGISYTGGISIRNYNNSEWGRIAGTGDFNGDGKTDLLSQHPDNGDIYVWYMDGIINNSRYKIGSVAPNTGWRIVNTGDFNGDGNTDILWQNNETGSVYVWYMNGTNQTNGAWMQNYNNSEWGRIVGTGDFNGDGKTDLLSQHPDNGDIYVWYMDGIINNGRYKIWSVAPNTGWRIVGNGDFNNDNKPDLLWQHNSTGEVYIWFMNGTNLISGASIVSSVTGWKIVAPK